MDCACAAHLTTRRPPPFLKKIFFFKRLTLRLKHPYYVQLQGKDTRPFPKQINRACGGNNPSIV